MMNATLLSEEWHPEPSEKLVESLPVKEGKKLSENESIASALSGISWEEFRGLSSIILDEDEIFS
jgi:hypothetical protein